MMMMKKKKENERHPIDVDVFDYDCHERTWGLLCCCFCDIDQRRAMDSHELPLDLESMASLLSCFDRMLECMVQVLEFYPTF